MRVASIVCGSLVWAAVCSTACHGARDAQQMSSVESAGPAGSFARGAAGAVGGANVGLAATRTHVAVIGDHEDNTWASRSGLVLLTEATANTAQGVMFGLSLQDKDAQPQAGYQFVAFKVE